MKIELELGKEVLGICVTFSPPSPGGTMDCVGSGGGTRSP